MDQDVLLQYRRTNNQVRRLTRKAKKQYEANIVAGTKENPKRFWQYVRKKTKSRITIPDLISEDGTTTTENDKEKANVLADYFSSVFSQESLTSEDSPTYCTQQILDVPITEVAVSKRLEALKISKSPGPDQIHPRILKEAKCSIVKPLTLIFRKSLDSGQLPAGWKTAHISAIFKKGQKNRAENYRPVSLTSIVVKLLEGIIREHITAHMKQHHLFSTAQFGFLSGRSTVLQLLTVLDKWTQNLDEGDGTDVIYCDFRKAFDKVPHRLLLEKAKSYGIQGKLIEWIQAFLIGRKQSVRVGTDLSRAHEVKSGIPQGSVLGPLLFVLFVNDLPQAVNHSSVYLFADDLKLFHKISTDTDHQLLQEDLNSVCKWTDSSQLQLHPDKCVAMNVGPQQDPAQYRLQDGHELRSVTQEKDLGVVIDSKLSFSAHVSQKVSKANSILGLVMRTIENKTSEVIVTLYKALIRPHLEYANQIWSPYLVKDVMALENVQRRVTRMIPKMKELSYEERLRKLKLPTLAYRRLRGDVIEIYKMTSGIYDQDVTENLLKFNRNTRTRGHNLRLEKPHCRLDIRKFSFFQRVVGPWNSLPSDIVNAPSLASFERKLDKHWSHLAIKFDPYAPNPFILCRR